VKLPFELLGTLCLVAGIWMNRYFLKRAPMPIEIAPVALPEDPTAARN
jgi:hypothetical protein